MRNISSVLRSRSQTSGIQRDAEEYLGFSESPKRTHEAGLERECGILCETRM